MRIACVHTVKNEEDVILHNIEYHSHIGVTDFYLFLDDSSDNTKDKIRTVPHICYFEDLTYQDLLPFVEDKPELDLELIEDYFSTHLGLRQVCNANMVLEICRNEGIDWLVHLDPDELICIDETRVEEDSLKLFLSSLDGSVDAVSFVNLEVMPTKTDVDFVFEDHLFKNNSAIRIQSGWPKSKLFNPFTNSYMPAGWFWGHSSGKLAVRPRSSSYFTSSHQCYVEGDRISSRFLLHYNIYSLNQFLNKYRNFANYPNRRRARPLRLLLRDVVNSDRFSERYIAEYYEKHIKYSESDIELIRKMDSGAIREIRSVSDFFAQRQEQAD